MIGFKEIILYLPMFCCSNNCICDKVRKHFGFEMEENDVELILRRKRKKSSKNVEDAEKGFLLKLKKKKGKHKESDASESEFTSVKVGMREHLKRLAMSESNRSNKQNSYSSPSHESNHVSEEPKSSKKLEEARSDARNAVTERVNKRVKTLSESKESSKKRQNSVLSPKTSTLLKEIPSHSEKLSTPGNAIDLTLHEEDEKDDMVYLQALEEVEEKLTTPQTKGTDQSKTQHTGTIGWLSTNPNKTTPQGVTPSVMQELERLKKENEALRKSQQDLIQTQHQRYLTCLDSSDPSVVTQEPQVVHEDIDDEEKDDDEDKACPIIAINVPSSPMNTPPRSPEINHPVVNTQDVEVRSDEEPTQSLALSPSNAVQSSPGTHQNIISPESCIISTVEHTTPLKVEQPKAVEIMKENARESENILFSAQQIKSRLRVIESSSSSSSSSSDTSDDSSSDGETSSNTLEAALKAVKTSFQPKSAPTSAKPSKKVLGPVMYQAVDKPRNRGNSISLVSDKGKNPPSRQRRASLTSQQLQQTKSSKCKSSLIWPLLDSFYDFVLDLQPNHVQIGQRNKILSSLSSLPIRYQSVEEYKEIQQAAILEELVASIRNALSMPSQNARTKLSLTSVSECSNGLNNVTTAPGSSIRLNSNLIFAESGFSGGGKKNDFILTFGTLGEMGGGGGGNNSFVNGDVVMLRSPPRSRCMEINLFGIVLCNSVVAVGSDSNTNNTGSLVNNDQICVLLRPILNTKTAEDFYRLTELSLSNVNNPAFRWSLDNVCNITTGAREYQAVDSLSFCPKQVSRLVLSGQLEKSSSCLNPSKISKSLLEELTSKYNKSQIEAIMGAVGEDNHIIIQGPPGTGKTRTILGIISALLDGAALSAPKKSVVKVRVGASLQESQNSLKNVAENSIRILIAAPSNAAVDEIVTRLMKEGVYDGKKQKKYLPRIVRVGRAESLTREMMRPNDRRRSRKYANEVEQVLLEQLVLKHRQAYPSAKIARQSILKSAQVVFCTLSGAGSVAMCEFAHEFDAVVIDEGAQAVEASALIPLKFRPKRMILVGDHRQLPATVISKHLIELGYDRSLFQRFVENGSPVFLLNKQYRMHPEIAWFPSSCFYQSQLINQESLGELTHRFYHEQKMFGPFVFFDVVTGKQSQVEGSMSLRNLTEVDFILALIKKLIRDYSNQKTKENLFHKKIGIISPYKQQIHELTHKIHHEIEKKVDTKLQIEINTVDGFQGREKEIIIYSCVRTSSSSNQRGARHQSSTKILDAFWADERRMNVAITRAKSSLWVIGNSMLLEKSQAWEAMIANAKDRGVYFLDSQVNLK